MFDYLVIGMVLHEELTGYDIKKRIEQGIGHLYKVSHGQLYPALKELTAKDYLTMNEQMQGKMLKKYYMATEAGKAMFLDWLSAPFDPNTDGDNYLVKIFLLGELPKEIRTKRLQEYEFYTQQLLGQLQVVEKQLSTENLSDREYFELSAFYFSYQLLQNTTHWIQYIKEERPLAGFLQNEGD